MPATEPIAVEPAGAAWFAQRGWTPFAFQREVWAAMADGRSGLLHASTGAGKTYAVWFGALARAAALGVPLTGAHPPPLGVLWLTPMRALAAASAAGRPGLARSAGDRAARRGAALSPAAGAAARRA